MTLTKETEVDKIDIVGDYSISIRSVTRIFEDGKPISRSYHRCGYNPLDDWSKETGRAQDLLNFWFNDSVKSKFKEISPHLVGDVKKPESLDPFVGETKYT